MELKFLKQQEQQMYTKSFNRTFMELKSQNQLQEDYRCTVLIVPLWN